MLDELGRVDVGDNDPVLERGVDLGQHRPGPGRFSTPMMIRSGWRKSATADPSRRNSGLEATSKSVVASSCRG